MTTSPAPSEPPFDKRRFRTLLGMYVLGVAIGCVLVGLILNAKRHFRPVPPPAPPAAGESAPAPVTPPAATPAATPSATTEEAPSDT